MCTHTSAFLIMPKRLIATNHEYIYVCVYKYNSYTMNMVYMCVYTPVPPRE